MARAGRKRKAMKPRTNTGRIKHAARDPRDNPTVVVLAQPHRNGSPSHWRATAWGRMLEDRLDMIPAGVSRHALYEAGGRFLAEYRAMLRATENRWPLAVTALGGGAEIAVVDAQMAIQRFEASRTALQRCGARQADAVRFLCLEPAEEAWQPPHWVVFYGVQGLTTLAEHYGMQWRGEDRERALDASRST